MSLTNGGRHRRLLRVLLGGALATVSCTGDSTEEAPNDRTAPAKPVQPAFPGLEWERAEPSELGFDPDVLDALAAEAQAGGANCLLVARHGRLAGEWYWNGTDASSMHQVFSITKSYSSTLVGIAQDEGLLDIDDPASNYIPGWAGTESAGVTIRQLLSLVSGRHPVAFVDNDAWSAYLASSDLTASALDRPQDHPPGSTWAISEADIQALEAVLGAATGKDPAEYALEKLLRPIGAQHTAFGTDGSGNMIMDAFAQATCQDLARLGHLYLNNGNWDGAQVVSAEWVEEATGRPGQDIYPGYGLLWWLNREGETDLARVDMTTMLDLESLERSQFVLRAPEDLYWAIGAWGQVLQVHPVTETVVVRLGAGTAILDWPSFDITTRIVTDALRPQGR